MPTIWYHREISKKISLSAQKFHAIVLTGARQTGKTELLKRLFPTHSYVSLDIPSMASMAEKEPHAFLERYQAPLLVDEVQYAPKLFRRLKTIIDQDRHNNGRFVLTGSQKFTLMKEVSESMAGRCAVFELETLSVCEILQNQSQPMTHREYADLITLGGFPELWRDRDMPLNMFLSSYLSTYLERDVRQILRCN